MANNNEEQISALVDDELSGVELRRALDRLREEPDLAHRWDRYHLISDALRNNLPEHFDHTFSQRVQGALQAEPLLMVSPAHRPSAVPGYLKQAAGLAVAASVTAVAILGFQNLTQNDERRGAPPLAGTEPAQYARLGEGSETNSSDALGPYLVNHNEYSVSSGMQGMLPYVRLVSQNGGE